MVALLSMHHLSPRSATRPSTKDGAVTSIQQARAARPAHVNIRRTSRSAASRYSGYRRKAHRFYLLPPLREQRHVEHYMLWGNGSSENVDETSGQNSLV